MKRITSLALSLVLASSLVTPSLAVDSSGSSGNSQAVVNQDPSLFSVTVPSGLPISIDGQGNVTVADNVSIVNNSYGPIRVENISVETKGDWSLVAYSKDFSKEKVGLHEYGLVLNTDEVGVDGSLTLSAINWPSISGKDSLPIVYNANLGVQKTSLTNEVISNVVFTVGWDSSTSTEPEIEYVLATDSDFSGTEYNGGTGSGFRYIGTDDYVEIPHVIKGVAVTTYTDMFQGTSVKGVKSINTNVTDMSYMFRDCQSDSLDLSNLDTSNVTRIEGMFLGCQATSLNLSNFNTSNVTYMEGMFRGCSATSLDLSSFDTSNVTNMESVFNRCQATTIDLSSFNTSNVTTMLFMFANCKATVLDLSSFDTSKVTDMKYVRDTFKGCNAATGYARTQADADKLNASEGKPESLTFVVK